MNYYDEILNKIEELISKEEYSETLKIIEEELNVPYIPREIESKFNSYYEEIKQKTFIYKSLNDEEIEKYLFMDKEHQLIAVSELDKKNLRDYLDLCNKYLSSKGFKNAKVLLIDSLIRQEINEEVKYVDEGLEYNFIPKYVIEVENSLGFLEAKKVIDDEFMKDPSMNKLAMDLLYKECLMALPVNLDKDEGDYKAKEIIKYIYKAFNQ